MTGSTILHYKVLEKLGTGGMGIVYKSEDTKLKRTVALKFIPQSISSDQDARIRFQNEAMAAASLNHPNITTIHAIEETDGELFLVLEYIEGEELKDRIKSAALSNDEVINIALQIAEGLHAAHKSGIVHRDIKSGNIMITRNNKVKIMDFGLAEFSDSLITKENRTAGTLSYISPEQLQGLETDFRTDIWSLGIVLYEMLTGFLPFKGDYDAALIYSILNEEFQPPSKINPNVPASLEKIISRCLKKNKEERYKNIEEVIKDLEESVIKFPLSSADNSVHKNKRTKKKLYVTFAVLLAGLLFFALFFIFNEPENNIEDGAADYSPKRLAVLPFVNIKNDKENNYLGFALADQVIGSLSYIKNILVRPSSAVRKYETTALNPPDIGRELNVEFILTGNYLKESDMVRLNLELVDVKSNEIIWRNDFDVLFKNTFTLQDIVSEKVVSGLKVRFNNEGMHSDVPKDPLAYEYYLRAVSYPLSNETNQTAIDLLKKTVEIDPAYAPAYSELGFRYQMLSGYQIESRSKIAEAESSYLKALSLNENLLSALSNLASFYTETGKTIEAIKLIKRALDINPDNANTHFWLGYIYRYTGLLEESVKEMELALKLDPGNPRFRTIGATYSYMNRFKEGIKGFKLDHESPVSSAWIGFIYFRLNKKDSAVIYMNKAINKDSGDIIGLWTNSILHYMKGDKKTGLNFIRKLENVNTYDGEQFYNFAVIYAVYKQREGCLRNLKKAIDAGFYCYPAIENESFYNFIRRDSAFRETVSITRKKSEDFRKRISEL
jgi:serine/threonine protein kinase/Tfp pilus assembly protein PilF